MSIVNNEVHPLTQEEREDIKERFNEVRFKFLITLF